jgi:DNA-binding NtrC family response regulator
MKKVLIVDDYAPFVDTLGSCIKDWGYEPIKMSDAEQAIDKINKGLEYDVAIIDTTMPLKFHGTMGGAVVSMASQKRNPKAKVIGYSSYPLFMADAQIVHEKDGEILYDQLKRILNNYLGSGEE